MTLRSEIATLEHTWDKVGLEDLKKEMTETMEFTRRRMKHLMDNGKSTAHLLPLYTQVFENIELVKESLFNLLASKK